MITPLYNENRRPTEVLNNSDHCLVTDLTGSGSDFVDYFEADGRIVRVGYFEDPTILEG